jgi:hypothetical protein
MTLNLEPNEINFLFQVIGELPTKTGAYVLLQKMEAQVKEQQQPSAEAPVVSE